MRRFSVNRAQATHGYIQDTIMRLFDLQAVPKLRYEDSESDLVTLGSDEETTEAFACCKNNVLRLQVTTRTETSSNKSNEVVAVEPRISLEETAKQHTSESVQSIAAELSMDVADLTVSMISDISACGRCATEYAQEKDVDALEEAQEKDVDALEEAQEKEVDALEEAQEIEAHALEEDNSLNVSTNLQDAVTVLERFAAAVVFTGYGSKSQFADIDGAINAVLPQLERFDGLYGHGKWIALFGGDPFTEAKPDIAHVMKFIQSQGVPVMAVQADKVLHEWGGCDKWLNFAYYYPTDYSSDGQVIWSGFHPDTGKLAGSSRIWFGDAFLPHVKAYVALGGGPIACDEVRRAQSVDLPVHYIRCEARYPEVNGVYGSVDELFASAASQALKNAKSFPSPSSSDGIFGGLLKKFGSMFSPPCLVVDDEDPAHNALTSEAEHSPAMGEAIASMGFFDETDLTASMAADVNDALQHIDDEVQQELHADEADEANAEEASQATDQAGEAEAEANGGDFTAGEAESTFHDALAAMESMGFEHSSASIAIAQTKGDTEAAVTLLLSKDHTVSWKPEWDRVCAELSEFGFSSTEQEIKSIVGVVKGSFKLAVRELVQRERNA